jgi:hypothetical protein
MPTKPKSKSVQRREAIQKGANAPAVEEAPSQKQVLLALYDQLNALGIRSISDLENLISHAE